MIILKNSLSFLEFELEFILTNPKSLQLQFPIYIDLVEIIAQALRISLMATCFMRVLF